MKRKKLLLVTMMLSFVFMFTDTSYAKNKAQINAPKWDGAKAADYAIKHAEKKDVNKMYTVYSSDCTNFASQCVFHGGKYMDIPFDYKKKMPKRGGEVYTTSKEWYYLCKKDYDKKCKSYTPFIASTSWVRCSGNNAFANYWYSYVNGTYRNLNNVRKEVSLGDVVQVVQKDGTIRHSLIVSDIKTKTVMENNKKKKKVYEIYFASHSSFYKNKSLNDVDKSARKSYGQGVKYKVINFKA